MTQKEGKKKKKKRKYIYSILKSRNKNDKIRSFDFINRHLNISDNFFQSFKNHYKKQQYSIQCSCFLIVLFFTVKKKRQTEKDENTRHIFKFMILIFNIFILSPTAGASGWFQCICQESLTLEHIFFPRILIQRVHFLFIFF